ncbi:DUF3152 domain-containing protein [Corynebacterium sp. Q4381]|uniref:DUF3152 domain-containing protein n=1 Tax=Corynebacterium sp. Marseille-Q4381 TaxID=3121597 RepID=UPI002FE5DBA7
MTKRQQRITDAADDWDDFDDPSAWEAEEPRRRDRRDRQEPVSVQRAAVPGGANDGKLVQLARDYGWRAYAIPVLAVITVFVIINMVQNPDGPVVGAANTIAQDAPGDGHAESAPEGADVREPAALPEGELDVNMLPPGGPFTEKGTGQFFEVGAPGASGGEGTELTVRYVVEVEEGVDTAAYGGNDAFSAMVDSTLFDPRGWTNDPRFKLEHVTAADQPTLRIRLASVETTRELCGGELGLETSCRTRITGEDTVLINESRWVRGAAPFQGDVGSYRQYVINHEVGHALGFAEHVPCPSDGALAPIMMQQTLSVNNAELRSFDPSEVYPDNSDTCRYNPWPYPRPAVL